MMKGLFTTYGSVDSPEIVEVYKPNNEPVIYNPLYNLIDKVKDRKKKQDTKKEDTKPTTFFDKEYQEVSTSKPHTQKALFKSQQEFVDKMRPIYKKILEQKGLSTDYVDYLVAQTALESGWGQKPSGKNNLGGIKVPRKQWGKGLGTVRTSREVINGKDVYVDSEFRDFDSLEDYAAYHVNLLNNMNYQAFDGDFINNVVRGGYATDPKYREVLNNVYNQIRGYA